MVTTNFLERSAICTDKPNQRFSLPDVFKLTFISSCGMETNKQLLRWTQYENLAAREDDFPIFITGFEKGMTGLFMQLNEYANFLLVWHHLLYIFWTVDHLDLSLVKCFSKKKDAVINKAISLIQMQLEMQLFSFGTTSS